MLSLGISIWNIVELLVAFSRCIYATNGNKLLRLLRQRLNLFRIFVPFFLCCLFVFFFFSTDRYLCKLLTNDASIVYIQRFCVQENKKWRKKWQFFHRIGAKGYSECVPTDFYNSKIRPYKNHHRMCTYEQQTIKQKNKIPNTLLLYLFTFFHYLTNSDGVSLYCVFALALCYIFKSMHSTATYPKVTIVCKYHFY